MSRKPYSRYSSYWYGIVVKMVQIYPFLEDDTFENTEQSEIARRAITQALEETENLEDGPLRIKAVKMLYFDKTHTIDGIAMQLYASRRVVQTWTSDFIKLVGKNAGYIN